MEIVDSVQPAHRQAVEQLSSDERTLGALPEESAGLLLNWAIARLDAAAAVAPDEGAFWQAADPVLADARRLADEAAAAGDNPATLAARLADTAPAASLVTETEILPDAEPQVEPDGPYPDDTGSGTNGRAPEEGPEPAAGQLGASDPETGGPDAAPDTDAGIPVEPENAALPPVEYTQDAASEPEGPAVSEPADPRGLEGTSAAPTRQDDAAVLNDGEPPQPGPPGDEQPEPREELAERLDDAVNRLRGFFRWGRSGT